MSGETSTIDKLGNMSFEMENVKKTKEGSLELKSRTGITKEFVVMEGVTMDSFKEWGDRLTEQFSNRNLKEESRMTNREGKEFKAPVNFATIQANSIFEFAEGVGFGDGALDVGERIFDLILNHGRMTHEEIRGELGGFDEKLLMLVINMMLKEEHLDNYVEEDGTKTLELVDYYVRVKRLTGKDPREERRRTLEHVYDEDTKFFISVLPPVTAAYIRKKVKKKVKIRTDNLDPEVKVINKGNLIIVGDDEISERRKNIKITGSKYK